MLIVLEVLLNLDISKTNIHGTIKNYLVVVNAGDFTYDIKETQGMIVSKPIEYAGTRYDISITIKTHDFYYNDGRKFSLSGDDLYDNIFIKSNLDNDIKLIAGSINNVLVGNFPVTITIENITTMLYQIKEQRL